MSLARKAAQLALVLSFLMIAVSSRAGEVSLPLKAEKDSTGGSGTAALDDGKIRIRAEGFRPNAVYTVRFINMNPQKHQAGAGTALYMFRSDGKGRGQSSTQPFSSCRPAATSGLDGFRVHVPGGVSGIPLKAKR